MAIQKNAKNLSFSSYLSICTDCAMYNCNIFTISTMIEMYYQQFY